MLGWNGWKDLASFKNVGLEWVERPSIFQECFRSAMCMMMVM